MRFALLFLAGCVSKGDHELIQVQLDATRTALSAKNLSCYEDMEARDARLAALELELEAGRARLGDLDERHQQLLEELEITRTALSTLITSCVQPDPEEEDPEEEPLPPLVQATLEEVHEALATRSRIAYEQERSRRGHQAIVQAFATLQEDGRLSVESIEGVTLLRIPSVQIFNEGRVSISPRGELLLQALADALRDSGVSAIQVAAHTDDRPHHTAEHNSSWELGFDQALAVVRVLEQAQVPASLSAASFAGQQPLQDNGSEQGRKLNRRIELIFGARPLETEPPSPEPEPAPEPVDEAPAQEG